MARSFKTEYEPARDARVGGRYVFKLPFGEEISINIGGRSTGQGYIYGSGLADPLRHKFTGTYERDLETELDYAQARYYASAHGRFTSADSVAGSPLNPQTLNLYTYVGNNPLKFIDPTGHSRQNPQQPGQELNITCVGNGCTPGSLGITVTVTAPPEQIETTDVQIVTELQIMTGVAQPIPPSLPSGNIGWAGALSIAGVLVVADGPFPAGDAAAGGWLTTFAIASAITAANVSEVADAIPDTAQPDDGVPLYRGVPVGHPGYADALQGIASPRGGHSNPMAHVVGDTRSIFTSWTYDPYVAMDYARRGGSGGVILFKNIEPSRIVPAPDPFKEGDHEVLVRGVVTGAKVIPVP